MFLQNLTCNFEVLFQFLRRFVSILSENWCQAVVRPLYIQVWMLLFWARLCLIGTVAFVLIVSVLCVLICPVDCLVIGLVVCVLLGFLSGLRLVFYCFDSSVNIHGLCVLLLFQLFFFDDFIHGRIPCRSQSHINTTRTRNLKLILLKNLYIKKQYFLNCTRLRISSEKTNFTLKIVKNME